MQEGQDGIPQRPLLWRRLFHAAAGSAIPVIAVFTTAEVMVALTATLAGSAIATEAVRLKLPEVNRQAIRWFSPLLKTSERRAPTAATYLVIASLVSFLVFDKSVAIVALLFVALGDPVAALVGSRVPGPRLAGKSPLGTVAFALVGLVTAWVLVAVDVLENYGAAAVGAGVAAVVELAPMPLDDNLTVPLVSGAAMTLLLLVM